MIEYYWIIYIFFGLGVIFVGTGWLNSLCYGSFICDLQYVDSGSLVITGVLLILGLVLIYVGIKKMLSNFATKRKGIEIYGIVVECCKFNKYEINKGNHYCLKVLIVDDENKVRIFDERCTWNPDVGTFLKVKYYKDDINIIDFVRSSLIPELEGNRLESCYKDYIKNKNTDRK